MGKMDQFKWKPHKKKPNKKPKLSVILKDHMDGLGQRGQLVEVERGFARNFLIPEGKAAYATKDNMKKYHVADKETESSPEAQISSKFMRFLKRTTLIIERKQDSRFEVSEHRLALEYQRQHQLYVPANAIKLSGPITQFGKHSVDIAVKEAVLVQMKVIVQPWTPKIPLKFQKVLSPVQVQEEKNLWIWYNCPEQNGSPLGGSGWGVPGPHCGFHVQHQPSPSIEQCSCTVCGTRGFEASSHYVEYYYCNEPRTAHSGLLPEQVKAGGRRMNTTRAWVKQNVYSLWNPRLYWDHWHPDTSHPTIARQGGCVTLKWP